MAKPKLRRGFVSEANRWALDMRHELGLLPHAPLCPFSLCDLLAVPVYQLSTLPLTDQRQQLLAGTHGFSASLIYDGAAAFVLLNDGHSRKRMASDLAHELAHLLLRHPASNPFDLSGTREYSDEHEAEADRLGPTLLVSDEAAVRAYKYTRLDPQAVAGLSDEWGITEDVIRMRINLSGARRRVKSAA